MKRIHILVVLGALLAGGQAVAQAPDEQEAARKAFREGDAAFKASRFEEALTAFERGYELSRRPRFLLNIAHTQRKLGQMRAALASYRRFLLTDPKPDDRDMAKDMAAEIEALLAEEDALRAANAPPPPTQPPQAAPEPLVAPAPVVLDAGSEPDDSPALYERWPFWAGVGVVVVAGVVAAVLLSGGDEAAPRSGSWGELRL